MKARLNQPWARRLVYSLSSGLILLLLLVITDPKKIALPILVLPFLCLFSLLYNLLMFFFSLFLNGLVKHEHARLISGILAAEPVLLLVLASIDQLTARDAILSLILMVGLAWYLSRLRMTE